MESDNYTGANVHQLYPGEMRQRESWAVMLEKLSTDMTNLWERQSSLIFTELNEKITTVKVASGSLVAGGVILFVGMICLAATAIIALSNIVVPWIAAALVAVVLMAFGLIMVKGAQKKLAGRGLIPNQSIEALGQIKNTFQERIHEFKKQ
jgi:hypothetical protein